MSSYALLIARDVTGLHEFAKSLMDRFDFQLFGFESIASEVQGAKAVTLEQARVLISESVDRDGIVVANYFDVETLGRSFMSWKKALASFDCALVELIRAAALKPERIAVIGNPAEYGSVLDSLEAGKGVLSQRFRMDQACNALHASSAFDAAVAQYLEVQGGDAPDLDALSGYPKSIRFAWKRGATLESGENAHQKAALYGTFANHFELLGGPALDYTSVVDVSAATYLIGEFEKTTIALVQKGTILAVASGQSLAEAWEGLSKPSVRNFRNGVCIVNASVDEDFAVSLATLQGGSVIAPRFSEKSLRVLDGLRLLSSKEGIGYEGLQEMRSAVGGALVQDKNRATVNPMEWMIRSFAQPLVDDWEDMIFAVKASRHLRSSSCIVVSGERIIAQSSGHPVQETAIRDVLGQLSECGGSNRLIMAVDETFEVGSLMAEVKDAGVSVIVHPGSLDPSSFPELSEAANEMGLTLVATGRSHLKI